MASSNVQAGMQAGQAFGPWGAAIGAGVGAATDLASQALGGANTASTDARSAFDGSGWNVATGGSTATGGARSGGGPDMSTTSTPQRGQPSMFQPGASLAGIDLGSPWLWLVIAGVAGVFLARKG